MYVCMYARGGYVVEAAVFCKKQTLPAAVSGRYLGLTSDHLYKTVIRPHFQNNGNNNNDNNNINNNDNDDYNNTCNDNHIKTV